MPARRPREGRRFSGLGIVVAMMVAAGLVVVFIVGRAYLTQNNAGLATPSQPATTARPEPGGQTSPVPARTGEGSSHARSASASASRTPSSASPAPSSASPSSAPASPSPAPSSPAPRLPRAAGGWLMTKNLLSKISDLDKASAKWFFNSPDAFVKGSAMPGLAATPIAGYTSYAQFSQDLADGSFPAGVKWVMYGLESTTNSPEVEKQNPAEYLKDFALLAHQHNLHVIEVPGRDLVGVPGAACQARTGEKYDQAFLRCHIAADARYANVFLIEAQGDQTDVSAYSALVTAAAGQVLAVAPHIRVMAGLTSDRGGSADQIFACWKATDTAVSGYWMNSTTSTLPVAAQALDLIRAASR
jgi:hypothetical protein